MQRRQLIQSAVSLACAVLPSAWAAWPDKPIKWWLSQAPGSGPDHVARILAEALAKLWGTSVVIDNRPGGQNTVGAVAAARATPDGNHFYFATTAALITNPLLFKQLPYDPVRDFVPVSFIARSPFALLVDAQSPIKTLDELIVRSKAAGGSFTVGNEGPRTFSGMIARLFNVRSGARANLVPYANVGVGTQNLMGGHVDAMFADLASTAALARQGKLRVLATTSGQRVIGWEQVPSLSEKWPNFDMVGWFTLMAPTGTPPDVIQRVHKDLQGVLSSPEIAQRIQSMGPLVDGTMSLEQVKQFLQAEAKRWSDATQEIGLLPE